MRRVVQSSWVTEKKQNNLNDKTGNEMAKKMSRDESSGNSRVTARVKTVP